MLVVGGPGVAEAVQRSRDWFPYRAPTNDRRPCSWATDPTSRWRDLAEASYAVGAGALLVATNTDTDDPDRRGHRAGQRDAGGGGRERHRASTPLVAGKPFAPLMVESVERIGGARPLIVGDRLDTDIEAGHRTGIPSLLVLTGVTGVRELLAAPPHQRPRYLGADLRVLAAPAASLSLVEVAGVEESDDLGELRACVPARLVRRRRRRSPSRPRRARAARSRRRRRTGALSRRGAGPRCGRSRSEEATQREDVAQTRVDADTATAPGRREPEAILHQVEQRVRGQSQPERRLGRDSRIDLVHVAR